jgi:hypothetical protein
VRGGHEPQTLAEGHDERAAAERQQTYQAGPDDAREQCDENAYPCADERADERDEVAS